MSLLTEKDKQQFPKILTRQQAQAKLAEVQHLTSLLGCALAERDQKVLEITAKRQPLINQLAANIKKRREQLEEWAKFHKEEEFGEKQSLEFPEGKLFFRLGNRRLELIDESWTWESVLERLLKFEDTSQWASYVRRDPMLDKAKLLMDTKGEMPVLPVARLKTIGLKIEREERFDLEVKPGPGVFETRSPKSEGRKAEKNFTEANEGSDFE